MEALAVGRYERKYVVSETAAAAIRKFVIAFLRPDPNMPADEPWGYRVNSLYLDSPHFNLYRHSAEGITTRFKLRIRFYSAADDSPAFLEIKKRIGETIHKRRAAVTRSAAEGLLQGRRPGWGDLLCAREGSLRTLEDFCNLRERLMARGTAFVSYRREAYVSRGADNIRVTFDRNIVGQSHHAGCGLTIPDPLTEVEANRVVLEMKYSGRAPGWMRDLVCSCGLQRISYPKYVHCVNALKLVPAMAG